MDNNHRHSDKTAKPVGAEETFEFEAERGLATDDTILNQYSLEYFQLILVYHGMELLMMMAIQDQSAIPSITAAN